MGGSRVAVADIIERDSCDKFTAYKVLNGISVVV
jgi:hypothetical protein